MSEIEDIQRQWAIYDPHMNTAPMGLIGRVLRCSKHLTNHMESVFSKHGLNRASFDMLATLLRIGPPHALTPNELIEQMLVSSGTMTNRIDKLEAKGYVARKKDKGDKRRVVVKITKKGKKLVESVLSQHIASQEHLVQCLSKAEMLELSKLLTKVLNAP